MEIGWFYPMILFVITYFGHRIYFKSPTYFLFSSFLLFTLLGAFSLSSIYHSNESKINENYYLGNNLYLFEIQDIANSKKDWVKVSAEVKEVSVKSKIIACSEEVILFIKSKSTIQIGDKVVTNISLEKIKNKGNPGEFDAEFYWKSKRINRIGFIQDGQFKVVGNYLNVFSKWIIDSRNYFLSELEKHLKGEELALAQALIIGDRSNLDGETINAFGNSGAMHVLAVSGLHIGIILQIIILFLGLFSKYITKKQALIIALVFIWLYTLVTGLSASVLRSTVMFSILAISQVYGKNHNSINSLFFTAFILLLINPLNLFDIGFQLSFLAMLGIFWFYKPILAFIYIENKWVRKLWETTAVGFAAQLLTVPLTLYYFHQFPNYFILTNIALMLVTGLILGFGMLVYAFSWVQFLGKLFVIILSISLLFTLKTVYWIDQLPGAVATGFDFSIWIVIISYLIIVLIYIFKNNKLIFRFLIFKSLLLVAFLVYQRYQNLILKEVRIFNHPKLVFIVKDGERSFCFYDSDNKGFNKIQRMVSDYSKIYPSKIYFFDINNFDRELLTNGLFIKVRNNVNDVKLSVNHLNIDIIKSQFYSEYNPKSKLIYMPWIQKAPSNAFKLADKSFGFLY